MMNHTAVSIDTRLSRIAGPVCMTRVAMRPAKSFWKKAQDCRATCQWFCQRIRFETLAAMAWFMTRCCDVNTSGRITTSTSAIPASIIQCSANKVAGSDFDTKVTTRPMNTGIRMSSMATTKPMANSAMNSAFAWRTKCQ